MKTFSTPAPKKKIICHIYHILFQNEDGVEVTDEDIQTEIHHLTMAVKAAQLDDYPESHSVSYTVHVYVSLV